MAVQTRYIYQNHHHKHQVMRGEEYHLAAIAAHVRRSVKYSTLNVDSYPVFSSFKLLVTIFELLSLYLRNNDEFKCFAL